MERIGIMGGSFDPIHQGHIAMAQTAMTALHLDRVLMMPTGTPPHKKDIAPAEDRYRMVCAACAGLDGLEPCREEIDHPGTSYTVDTLSRLHEKYPKAKLFCLIGEDKLMALHGWRHIERVFALCTMVVFPRATGYTREELDEQYRRLTELGGRFITMDTALQDAASTDVRQALCSGADTSDLPVAVREYIRIAGLYGMPPPFAEGAAWLDRLFRDLSKKRFAHTLAVADTARKLALLHGLDAEKAEIAGLLHDCAKCMPLKEMQQLARKNHLTEDERILQSGALLHSIAGAYRAQADYGMTDPEVIDAILSHTTGKPGMSRLDMAVWLADTIEPTRAPYPLLEDIRTMANVSLAKAMILSLEGTLRHVRKKGDSVHPATLQTLEWLRTLNLD